MTTLVSSWIGGGANMVAMREVFAVDETTFGQLVVVDAGASYVKSSAPKRLSRASYDALAIEAMDPRLRGDDGCWR